MTWYMATCIVAMALFGAAGLSSGCGDDDANDGQTAGHLELSRQTAADGTKCYILHNTSSGDVALDCEE